MAADAGGGGGGGMEKAELKKALTLARRQTMHVGLADDGGKIILVMDKIKKGRALVTELEGAKPKPKDPRFGEVDSDPENRRRAIFTLNKPVGGLARKLVKALKGTGVSKVLLKYEDGTPEESEEGEDEEVENDDGAQGAAGASPADANGAAPAQAGGQTDAAAPAQQAQQSAAPQADTAAPAASADTSANAAPADTSTQAAASPQPAADAGGGQQAGAPGQPDQGGLIKVLADLVKQIKDAIGADPSKAQSLTAAAQAAQAALKGGDLSGAGQKIETLRQLLGGAGGAGGAAGAAAGANGAASAGANAANDAAPANASAANGPASSDPSAAAANGAASAESSAANGAASADPNAAAGAAAGAAGGAKAAGGGPADAVVQKSRQAWDAARQKVDGEFGKLRGEFEKAFQGHEQQQTIAKAFEDRLDGVMKHFDDTLSKTLDGISKAATPDDRSKAVTDAKGFLQHAQQVVQMDPTIKELAQNPFHQMDFGFLTKTLEVLSKSLG